MPGAAVWTGCFSMTFSFLIAIPTILSMLLKTVFFQLKPNNRLVKNFRPADTATFWRPHPGFPVEIQTIQESLTSS